MMLPTVLLLGADTGLERIDKDSLSHSTLMEIFLGKIKNKELVCGPPQEQRDLCSWQGVTVNKETSEILHFEAHEMGLDGKIDLKWMPDSMKTFEAFNNKFTGTVSMESVSESALTRLTLGKIFCLDL